MALFCGVCTLSAQAAVIDIDAVFRPDPSAPQKNEFVNKTPSQGFCKQVPMACEPQGLFSMIAPIAFTASAPIRANHEDPRQGGMAKVPSEWRDVLVTHQSGKTRTVKVRIAGIGHESQIPLPIAELTQGGGWDQLWKGGGWAYSPAPCGGVGWYSAGAQGYNSFWTVPPGAGACAKQALFEIPLSFRYQYFVLGYQMITPNPMSMESGHYQGSITYGVGPHQDFDMGDVMLASDSTLTLNFNLDVLHTLKIDIPPGGEKVTLVPAGGWQGWLQAGRRPERLFRDQSFNISASSRFKMQIQCGPGIDNECALENRVANRRVRLFISVSLPNGLTDLSGQPVRHRRLMWGAENAQLFQPGFYVDRAPGALHFEVPQSEMEFMLKPGFEGTYAGVVIVIWDSEV